MRILQFFFLGLSIAWFLSPAYANSVTQQHHLQQIKQQVTSLQKQLQQKQRSSIELQQELASIETHYGETTQQLQQTSQQLAIQQQDLLNLHKKVHFSQQTIQQQQYQLAEQLRTAYMLGNQPYLKFLLEQNQAENTSRLFHYFHYLTDYQVHSILILQHHILSMQNNEKQIQQHYQTLLELKRIQYNQQLKLASLKSNRTLLLREISHSIQNKHQQLAQLIMNRRQLEKTIDALHEQINKPQTNESSNKSPQVQNNLPQHATINASKHPNIYLSALQHFINKFAHGKNFADLRGHLPWPTVGKISQHFGAPMDEGGLRWDGVLLNASLNQPVFAVADGRVVFAKWLAGYGLLIIVSHGNGYMTLYGRNGSLYKKVNDAVHAGDMIGSVGESGGYQQAKLYFAIRHDAKPLNPSLWCH